MKKDVERVLRNALASLGVSPVPDMELEVPKVQAFGDISSPVAMGLARQMKKAPRKIAEEIVAAVPRGPMFEKIEIAGPGFINFTFSSSYLHESLRLLLCGEKAVLREDVGVGRRVLVEFVSANPTGPLHIGHGRGAAVGNALCNLLSQMGFSVEREFYINDAGRQVRLLGESVFAAYMRTYGGAADYPFPGDGYKGDYIADIARDIQSDVIMEDKLGEIKDKTFDEAGEIFITYSYAKMLELIKNDLRDFGVSFDSWKSEKELYEKGEVVAAIGVLKDRGALYEKEGALWFSSSEFGDDKDRVVVKSDGEYTYFASDIAYHKDKLDRGFDIIIDIWGADHHGYIPRIASVMKAFGYDTSRFKVILVQMVNLLKEGKPFQMSKRAGNFVLLSEVVSLVDADNTKFMFLTRKSDSHLDFDIDVVTESSAENPVYYVQYAHARINSIMKVAAERGVSPEGSETADLSLLSGSEELGLVKKLLSYPMVLAGAARSFEPHRLTFYVQELASLFHAYYHKTKVLTDDDALSAARLALCAAIKVVFADALAILGVTAPDKM